jgi:glyoxylase-like metal-dependent hydrolase (beta-lactamase superfamily II)
VNIRNISSGISENDSFAWINAYLIDGSGVIDPGMGYDMSQNVNIGSIDDVFLTFPYLEHFGILEDLEFDSPTIYTRNTEELNIETDYELVEVSGGDKLILGGTEFEVIERNGIMPSLGLYNPEEKVLFAGHLFIENHEMIDSKTTKKVYLDFLRKVEGLEIDTIYPAHGNPASADFVREEIRRVEKIVCDNVVDPEIFFADNSMVRAYEHEWNRGFDSPYREYFPHEKWMFYAVDPSHGTLKSLLGILLMYLSNLYLMVYAMMYSEQELEFKYSKD